MRTSFTLCLVILIITAGCAAVPFGDSQSQENPAPVVMKNNASIVETFEVAVIPVGDNVSVTRKSGDVFNYTIKKGSSTYKTSSENKFTKMQFPNSADKYGTYTLKPGEQKSINISEVSSNEAIVILIYDEPENSYRALRSINCGGAINGYSVTTEAEGEDDTVASHACSAW